jgi:hypothetical protein
MRYFSPGVSVLLVLLLVAMPRGATAVELPEPERGLCREIVATVNAVADFTETLCLPSRDPEGISLVLISSQPVFAIEAAKRAWLMTSVGTVASVLAEAGTKTHLLILTDAEASRDGRFFAIAPPVAQDLLRQARAGALGPEQYYERIVAAMRRYPNGARSVRE